MTHDLTGKTLGPFLIEGKLGQGAMGLVYRAHHTTSGKPAAIKVMVIPEGKSKETFAARFEREIKLLSQFRHPNIVRIYGSSEQDGIRYYAMELVEGQSLQDILDARRKLTPQRAVAYGIQICEALQEIHAIGVVHRDLKPPNLLVTKDHKVKLTDFGIAKNVVSHHTSELTQADHTVGTVAYMSPEQLSGQELTRKSDIYALGILLYRMLTGRLPFSGETMFEYMNQRMAGSFPLPSTIDPNIPFEFDALIKQMLAQDPLDRPRDAFVVMQSLLDIAKKAKEGTLLKTRPKTQEELAETVEMSRPLATLLRTVTGLGGSGEKKKRKGKQAHEDKGPLYESPWFLAGCLALVLGITAYLLWPPGPEVLVAKANELLDPENPYTKWQQALDEYLIPVAQSYPEYARETHLTQRIEEVKEEVAKAKARGIAQRGKMGLRRPEASEAERKYIDALILSETLNHPVAAQQRFQSIVDAFGASDDPAVAPWVALARDQFKETSIQTDEERLASKRAEVQGSLANAMEEKEKGEETKALRTYAAIVDLYRGDADVADLLEEAAAVFQPKGMEPPAPTATPSSEAPQEAPSNPDAAEVEGREEPDARA